jgi:hypothetical protein
LIIFLKVISKVLFFNITPKFTNLLVQLSIFLIDLFVGTYRLSSHARLEAFVIQTKLNYFFCDERPSVLATADDGEGCSMRQAFKKIKAA